ncbi:hypothetical protein GCM10010412_053240 [Nonomuraea recticatena]|uniref:Uncharacterized protein n=1 Tax=Nonomuraea recticatena TaxID=46178 RepID=A0ABN3SBA4_9ACTN
MEDPFESSRASRSRVDRPGPVEAPTWNAWEGFRCAVAIERNRPFRARGIYSAELSPVAVLLDEGLPGDRLAPVPSGDGGSALERAFRQADAAPKAAAWSATHCA